MILLLREFTDKGIVTFSTNKRENLEPEILTSCEHSLVDVLNFRSIEETKKVQEEKYYEYFIQVSKEPSLTWKKGLLGSGETMIDWSRFFSQIFKGLV